MQAISLQYAMMEILRTYAYIAHRASSEQPPRYQTSTSQSKYQLYEAVMRSREAFVATSAVAVALFLPNSHSFRPLVRPRDRDYFLCSKMSSKDEVAPLIRLPEPSSAGGQPPPTKICNELVAAFQKSGFLRISSPFLPISLQKQAIGAATAYLVSDAADGGAAPEVVTHPSDPKSYCMLTSKEDAASVSPMLAEYIEALEKTKMLVLHCLAVGLSLPDPNYFSKLHSENNSSLRLLRYPATAKDTGNRCKEHSDYGSITLLLTDGVSGLEAYHEGKWIPVPHEEGCLVVNAGSLLESWTNGKIPATLHRVAGPTSEKSCSSKQDLLNAVGRDRTSLAFFADPNTGVKALLQDEGSNNDDERDTVAHMSVADYILWRSGGADGDTKRSGLAFTTEEEGRVQGGGSVSKKARYM